MNLFCIQATKITRISDSFSRPFVRTSKVPTFYLDADSLGIKNDQYAFIHIRRVAEEIIRGDSPSEIRPADRDDPLHGVLKITINMNQIACEASK